MFNYLGQFDGSLGCSDAPFALAARAQVRRGARLRPCGRWLNMTGRCVKDVCGSRSDMGASAIERATVERLAALYGEALRELVAHCTQRSCGLTPSDFALSGLESGRPRWVGNGIGVRGVEDIYPLSPMQQGMLFHALKDGEQRRLCEPGWR